VTPFVRSRAGTALRLMVAAAALVMMWTGCSSTDHGPSTASPAPRAATAARTPASPQLTAVARDTVAAGTAAYLSIGDSIQYGCCHDRLRSSGELFRRYLEQRLNRDVEWITTAGNDTADEFVHGSGGATPQLARAVSAIQGLRAAGRPIVSITLSIGGNDYVEVGQKCAAPPCNDIFLQILERMKPQLDTIYSAIVGAKPPETPLFVVLYYNASDCGQPGVETSPTELGQRVWNATIDEAARRHGAIIVDAYTPFKGRACDLIETDDPNYEGYQVLADAYERAYQALPVEFVTPFQR